MKLTLTADVGVFNATAECSTWEEAKAFVQWVYQLEGSEERQAIATEQVGIEPVVDFSAPTDVPTDATAETITVDQAADAVKAYAQRHGIDRARELMQQFGVARTSAITAEVAANIYNATQEAA